MVKNVTTESKKIGPNRHKLPPHIIWVSCGLLRHTIVQTHCTQRCGLCNPLKTGQKYKKKVASLSSIGALRRCICLFLPVFAYITLFFCVLKNHPKCPTKNIQINEKVMQKASPQKKRRQNSPIMIKKSWLENGQKCRHARPNALLSPPHTHMPLGRSETVVVLQRFFFSVLP